jgi:hypothetical protein
MRRRRHTYLGMSDGDHRRQADFEISAAQINLVRFKKVATCGEKLRHLKNAADFLARAAAHQRSVEEKGRNDADQQKTLRDLDRDYQRAWEHVRRRCVRK